MISDYYLFRLPGLQIQQRVLKIVGLVLMCRLYLINSNTLSYIYDVISRCSRFLIIFSYPAITGMIYDYQHFTCQQSKICGPHSLYSEAASITEPCSPSTTRFIEISYRLYPLTGYESSPVLAIILQEPSPLHRPGLIGHVFEGTLNLEICN